MAPNGWSASSVGEICNFINGNGFKPTDWSEDGLPIIRIQNLNGSNKFNYFDGTPKDHWLVNKGDLLFAWAGSRGVSFGARRWNGPTGVLNQHIYRVESKNEVDVDWLYLVMLSVTERVERKAHGFKATLLHVQKADITEQIIYVPPLPEQRNIAKILQSWDSAIDATKELIETSKQQKKALMQQLLTGKKRFSGIKVARRKDTRYGSIPSDWNYLPISEIADQYSEKNARNDNYPVVSCSKHLGFIDSLKYFKKKVYSADLKGYKIIPKGCFGFPSNHIEEGSIGCQMEHNIGLVSPIYTVFKPRIELVDNRFLLSVLKTDQYRQIFSAATNASVDRRGSLRWKEFSLIKIALPSLEEQHRISNVLADADDEINQLASNLAYLMQEKKALMQQLLTGKRRSNLKDEN